MAEQDVKADGYYGESDSASKEDFDLSFLDDESEK